MELKEKNVSTLRVIEEPTPTSDSQKKKTDIARRPELDVIIVAECFIDARSYVDELIESNPKNPAANQLLFKILNDTRDYDLILRKIFEFSDYINDDELAQTIMAWLKML